VTWTGGGASGGLPLEHITAGRFQGTFNPPKLNVKQDVTLTLTVHAVDDAKNAAPAVKPGSVGYTPFCIT
jgi:hypothetical protein